MKPFRLFNPYTLAVLLICSMSINVPAYAAPGVLSDTPLFLLNRAKPNVFFMVDDSGSMDFGLSTGATPSATMDNIVRGVFGTQEFSTDSHMSFYFYVSPIADNLFSGQMNWTGATTPAGALVAPTQAVADASSASSYLTGIWRLRNSDYNRIYYNPKTTYSPWPGKNALNQNFGDAPPTCAPIDPNNYNYSTSTGTCQDLTTALTNVSFFTPCSVANGDTVGVECTASGAFGYGTVEHTNQTYFFPTYWVWDDTNLDGIVDATETHELREIRTGVGKTVCPGGTEATVADQLANDDCLLRSDTEELQNFANWWTYYRKRELTAKTAIASVVNDTSSGIRMGISTINENGGSYQLNEVGDATAPVDLAANKQSMLRNVYQINSNGGTPLRRALQRVGNYYSCSGTTPFGGGACGLDELDINGNPSNTASPAVCSQNFAILIADGDWNGGDPASIDDEDSDNSTDNGLQFDGNPYADSTDETLADVAMHYYERDLHPADNGVSQLCGIDENPGQHMVTYTVNFGVQGTITPPTHPQRGYAAGCPSQLPASAFAWPAATSGGPASGRINDMVHAAFNGRGEALDARSPEELAASLNDAIRSITNRLGSASAVTFNSGSVNANAVSYVARFDSTNWTGELYSFPIPVPTLADNTLDTSQSLWGADVGAHSLLNGLSDHTDRAIVTYNKTGATGIPFRASEFTNLTTEMQNDLRTDTNGVPEVDNADLIAQERLNHIRGDFSCENESSPCTVGTTPVSNVVLRNRNGERLGDIANASPVYVGTPIARIPSGAPFGEGGKFYRNFRNGDASASTHFNSGQNATNRTPMLYVGANDGMLHAFNANTGAEVWAYVPNAVTSDVNNEGLHHLTETDYRHTFYVDETPAIADAYIDIAGDSQWRTVLVGALGVGGKGLFAIDVTDPDELINASASSSGAPSARETALANKVMWEFTAADDPDLGYTYGKPTIIPLGDSSSIEYYVVVNNGYNSGNSGGSNPFSAKLFLLKLTGPTGAGGTWVEGTDYYKLDTEYPAGVVAVNDQNGLSAPAPADTDGNSIIDRIYAGDLYGHLWGFDVSSSNPSQWGPYKSGSTVEPIFTASSGDGVDISNALIPAGIRQPITTRPALSFHPTIEADDSGGDANIPNIMIYFGTGSYVASTDPTNTDTQSFYAVWDRNENGNADYDLSVNRTSPGDATNNLLRRNIQPGAPITLPDGEIRQTRLVDNSTTTAVDYTTQYGWYMDLPEAGERVNVEPVVVGGVVFFFTNTPNPEPCGFGGSTWFMFVTANDGYQADFAVIDLDESGTLGDAGDFVNLGGDKTAGGIQDTLPLGLTVGSSLIAAGGSGCPDGFTRILATASYSSSQTSDDYICVPSNAKTGRFSWRELKFNN